MPAPKTPLISPQQTVLMDAMQLTQKARWARKRALEMAVSGGKAHLGGSFSCTEILVALYYGGILRVSPNNIHHEDRDRFILSKGHACQVLYAILADLKFFDEKELENHGKNGTMLGGHPDHFIPGVEVSSGSLGHGLGIGCGLALSAKLNKKKYMTVVLVGDGECCEGSIWEAAMFAVSQKLNNLVVIVDHNNVSAIDRVETYTGNQPLDGKWRSFGWETVPINGHNFDHVLEAFRGIRERDSSRPLAIVAETVKGKGVSFMEHSPRWHHGVPSGELLEQAMRELIPFHP